MECVHNGTAVAAIRYDTKREHYYDERLSIASKKQGLPTRRGKDVTRRHCLLP